MEKLSGNYLESYRILNTLDTKDDNLTEVTSQLQALVIKGDVLVTEDGLNSLLALFQDALDFVPKDVLADLKEQARSDGYDEGCSDGYDEGYNRGYSDAEDEYKPKK